MCPPSAIGGGHGAASNTLHAAAPRLDALPEWAPRQRYLYEFLSSRAE